MLVYLIDAKNLRPALLPALVENPSVPEKALAELACSASPETLEVFLNSPRAHHSSRIVESLRANLNLDSRTTGSAQSTGVRVGPATGHNRRFFGRSIDRAGH